MSEPRIVVWHDERVGKKWLVAVQDAAGRHYNERPYTSESDAVSSAKAIGQSMRWPVIRRAVNRDDELIQPVAQFR
jgi:hypothetical protein